MNRKLNFSEFLRVFRMEGDGGEKGGEIRKKEPVKIVAISCGNLWVWALSESGYTRVCNIEKSGNSGILNLVENFKWGVPYSKKGDWASVFFWLILGKLDPGSKFYWPVEITI
jgi:hypothetical protein